MFCEDTYLVSYVGSYLKSNVFEVSVAWRVYLCECQVTAIDDNATCRVLDRLKQVGVRTSSRKNFGVRAAFAGRMPYFTIIRPIVSLLTVHNIIHINVKPPKSIFVKQPRIFLFPARVIILPCYLCWRRRCTWNQLCKIFWKSVEGFRSWKTLKMAFPIETVHRPYNSAALPRRLWYRSNYTYHIVQDRRDDIPLTVRSGDINMTSVCIKAKVRTVRQLFWAEVSSD